VTIIPPIVSNPLFQLFLLFVGLGLIWLANQRELNRAATGGDLSGLNVKQLFKSKWLKYALISAVGCSVFAGLGTFAVMAWHPPVYGPFREVYSEYAERLGRPLHYNATIAQGAYQGKFFHATVLWFGHPLKFYVIQGDGQWHEEHEDSFPLLRSSAGSFYEESFLRERFKPPPGFGPPFGSAAYLWSKEPKRWEQMIGWREWQCNFGGSLVQYQDFEHGRILGTFLFRPDEDSGEVFVLFDNHMWVSAYSGVKSQTNGCSIP